MAGPGWAAIADTHSLPRAISLAAWVGFMAYAEGYRGFQRRFAPRVASRAMDIARSPDWVGALLAPLVAMGLWRAEPALARRMWTLLAVILAMVLGVRALPEPWRQVVDAGVVAGLSWGVVSMLMAAVNVVRSDRPAARVADAVDPSGMRRPATARRPAPVRI